MAEKLVTKNDLLNKLRAYNNTPDDENILYKKKIEKALLSNPCLLYALNEKTLEPELFDDDGNINWEWNKEKREYEPLGEWDRYFSDTAGDGNILPYLFIPDTQTKDTVRYQPGLKETLVTFTIFVHGNDRMDKLTGIPRHDLIASIIRERFAWSNIFGMQTHIISNRESTTDNNYVVRTLVFQLTDLNSKVQTPYGGQSQMMNYQLRR